MKLKESRGLTAGIVMSLFGTVADTSTAMVGQRTEAFPDMLGACVIAVGMTWFFVQKLSNAQDPPNS